jgi:hypothetical protein
MAFRPPGGELTLWSAVWIVFGIAATIAAATMGLTGYYILGACVGLPALGMWFEQRWCGYLFAGPMALTIPLAVIAIVTVDDTFAERAYRALRIALAGYFAFIAFRWAQDE